MFAPIVMGTLLFTACMAQVEETKSDSDEICCENECKEMAREMKNQMKVGEPCIDFYKYVCGNWNGSSELKQKVLKPKAVQDLIGLLEAASEPSAESPNATDKLILAYRSCTKKGKDIEALKTSITNVLGNYSLKQWPVISLDNETKRNYKQILEGTGPLPVFRYFVSDEQRPPTIVMTKPIEFYVSDKTDYDQLESLVDPSEDTLTTVNYEEYDNKFEEAYKEFIKDAISLLNDTATEPQKSAIVDEIIEFERNLSKLAYEAGDTTDNMTLGGLNNLLKHDFQMEKVLAKDFSVITQEVSASTKVEVHYKSYYQKAIEFMNDSNTTRPLLNYIGWTKVRSMAEAEGTLLHDIYLKYKNKTFNTDLEEKEKTNDANMSCMYQLLEESIMYTAGANYYSNAKFDKAARDEVLKILHFINSTFRHVVLNNSWMSPTIKEKATNQLNTLTYVVGYPEWMLNSTIINSLYQFVPKTGDEASFVEHYYWLQENQRFQELLKLSSSYFVKTNEAITLRSHALYKPQGNILGYPAAALVTHYRKTPIPRSINFGTIGAVLAGLYTYVVDRFHGFTAQKKTFPDFWDDETKSGFCTNSKCLNNTEECYDTQALRNSSYQHLDDYLGLRVSHQALVQSKVNYSEPLLLPGEEFDSEDKIFLTAYGSLYCPYSVNEKWRKVQPRSDETEEEKLPKRLNEVVSIYNDFNKTFGCNGTVSDTCNLMPGNNSASPGTYEC